MNRPVKLDFVTRPNEQKYWGGDLKTLYAICEGMKELGHEAKIVPDIAQLKKPDFVFLSNTTLDLNPQKTVLDFHGLPYGLIPFHEDFLHYMPTAAGFYYYIRGCLDASLNPKGDFSLDDLIERPYILNYYAMPPVDKHSANEEVIRDAKICIANSETEAKTLRRDAPGCNAVVVPWAPGFAEDFKEKEITDEFLRFTGLKSGEYILQVGRIQSRKNQLATILATRDIDAPLVFITTTSGYHYLSTCLAAIVKWRKAPTFLVAQHLPAAKTGPHRILPMPGGKKLSSSMLSSAFAHAGLHLHPAYYELPGATYFESAYYGVPTIASSWTTIGDYFKEVPLDDRIEYCLPYALSEITRLVQKKMGQKFSRNPQHPVFQRTRLDVAKDIECILTPMLT